MDSVGGDTLSCTHYKDINVTNLKKPFHKLLTIQELQICQMCNGFLLSRIQTVLPWELFSDPERVNMAKPNLKGDKTFNKQIYNLHDLKTLSEIINSAQDTSDKIDKKIQMNKLQGVSVRICIKCGFRGCE